MFLNHEKNTYLLMFPTKDISKTKIESLMKLHPFTTVKSVRFSNDAKNSMNIIIQKSEIMNKEFGGIGCYEEEKENIHVKKIIALNPVYLSQTSYPYFSETIKNKSNFLCRNKIPLLFHTHQNGSSEPSKSDRINTLLNEEIGCLSNGNQVSCFIGEKDLAVLS